MKSNILLYIAGACVAALAFGCGGHSKADKEFDRVANQTYGELGGSPSADAYTHAGTAAGTPAPPVTSYDSIIVAAASGPKVTPVNEIKQGPRRNDRIPINNIGRLADVFNDSNYLQYRYAEALGIEPIKNLRMAYRTRRPIVYVKSNKYYEVDSLTHSLPYLVPEAEKLLTDIGRGFIDSLRHRGADGYRIRVTSLLRTPHTVKRLRRVNVNATDSSTHQFGTTFDLSYTRFHCLDSTRTIHDGDLKNLLAEVLLDLRTRGRCLVKFERKTGCFHVTATH